MHSLGISIAGISLRVDSESVPITTLGAMSRFVIEPPSDPDCSIEVVRGCREVEGDPLFDSGGVWTLHREGQGYRFDLTSPAWGESPYAQARFDEDLKKVTVHLSEDRIESGDPVYPLAYPLDELIVTNLLARLGGIELHACGVVAPDGSGVVFCAQSGGGKTTTARLWHDAGTESILSDDRIILRKTDDGIRMFGTPWHGEEAFAIDDSAPLRAILFLRHESENETTPLAPIDALARISTCSFFPLHDRKSIENTLAFLEEVVREVRCAELGFVPDQTAVEFVKERLGLSSVVP